MPTITMLYAGILGLMAIGIAFAAGSLRGKTGISIGDGGNTELLLAMRRHSNFVEVVPLTVLIIAMLEMKGISSLAVHIMCVTLVLSRIAHAVGLKAETIKGAGRVIGAGGSALVMLVASIWAIVVFF